MMNIRKVDATKLLSQTLLILGFQGSTHGTSVSTDAIVRLFMRSV
jgi:hypothetical protein